MRSRRIVVLNPNTDTDVTRMMVAIAAESAPESIEVEGATVASGARLILDPRLLEEAGYAVAAMAPDLAAERWDGVVVAAFGDPGMDALRRVLACPVAGLAEASMAAAASRGRRFCVVTTTPDLASAIDRRARDYGHEDLFAGVFCTPDEPGILMADPAALPRALEAASARAIGEAGVETIIIGGGPLALAARTIRDRLPVCLIEPVREAVADLARRMAVPVDGESLAASVGTEPRTPQSSAFTLR